MVWKAESSTRSGAMRVLLVLYADSIRLCWRCDNEVACALCL